MTPIDARKDSMGYQTPAMRARCDDSERGDDIEQQLKALLARRRRLNCSGGRDGEDVALIRAALVAKQGGAA